MPEKPASVAQLGYVHAEANRGAPWAERTVSEWHGKTFGSLPAKKGKKVRKKIGKRKAHQPMMKPGQMGDGMAGMENR